ncbi:hypothetical protein PoB_002803200 [Plakobranchus ocellatus]|uniref:Ubiquitin-like domain-containing protein n=1 Tax=Plakobranchus ocellatus TaxID=259542 RepID=A0AAV4A3U1_9GAST|nr:hypothetical protein PoB_002803200 [Plakobranchus ocellatus]
MRVEDILCQSTTKTVGIKQKKVPAPISKRSATYAYHFTLPDGTSKQVCKSMYCSTLGISPQTVVLWLSGRKIQQDDTESIIVESKSKAPKSGWTARASDDDLNFLASWLNSLPTDQCNQCIKFQFGAIREEEQSKHITDKNQARESKSFDKNDGNSVHSIWTADLQAVDAGIAGCRGGGTDAHDLDNICDNAAVDGKTGRGENATAVDGKAGRGENATAVDSKARRGDNAAAVMARLGGVRMLLLVTRLGGAGRGENVTSVDGKAGRGENATAIYGKAGRGENASAGDGKAGRGENAAGDSMVGGCIATGVVGIIAIWDIETLGGDGAAGGLFVASYWRIRLHPAAVGYVKQAEAKRII